MKRLFPILLTLIILAIGAVIFGPSLMDWNKYKPQIIAQAKNAAGYDIKIDGDIGLAVLPMPQLKIEGISVKAPRGRSETLLSMKRADVTVSLLPLLSGEIQINTVRLVSPVIVLEKLPDGSNSWMSDKLLTDQKGGDVSNSSGAAQKSAKKEISLGHLTIDDGKVTYTDRMTGKTQEAEAINLDLQAGSLSAGPYQGAGSMKYAGRMVEIEAKTERLEASKKEIPASFTLSLPEDGAVIAFKGVMAAEPLEIQGKLEVKADNLAAALAGPNGAQNRALAQNMAFTGLVTANDDKIVADDMVAVFGDAKGKGKLTITGLKDKAPVKIDGDLAFGGTLNLDKIAAAKNKANEPSVEEKVAKGQKLAKKSSIFLPETLSLPFLIEGGIRFTAEAIQSGGKTYKGVNANLSKTGQAITIAGAANDIPGRTKVEGKGTMRYASASKSGETGVTYADPNLSFTAAGTSEQLPTLLRSFLQGQGDNKALEIWKTARFDLNGNVASDTVTLSNSTIKLDDMAVAVAASYRPQGAAGRADVMLDLSMDLIDLDFIKARMDGQNKSAVPQSGGAAKVDAKAALAPVQGVNIPVNLTFDISAQKAILNAQKIEGIRIKGKAAGTALSLETASAQNLMGAVASLKGDIGNLADLSGIDMKFYGKTSDLKTLMIGLKMDTSKLPAAISGAEANVAAKGTADALNFGAQIAALSGELKADGVATNILGKPSFNSMTIGASHLNLVKAVQIFNPSFKGGANLERPFTFSAKATPEGEGYALAGMKASLGGANFSGDLKIGKAGTKTSITGNLNAGRLALDDLLGAKNAAAKSGGGSGGGAGSGGGKWSRSALDTGWMHAMDMNLNLSAQAITYGGWNFTNPKTKIILSNGDLTVEGMNAGLFGGSATLDAKVKDPVDFSQPLTLAIRSKMDNVAVESLMLALSGSNRMKASGNVSLDMDVSSVGLSPHALVSGLSGKANLDGKTIVMKGFDLAQIGLAFVDTGKPLDRLGTFLGGATTSGETRFEVVTGSYLIDQGIVSINNMVMDGAAANIKSTGSANLPLWTIDTIHAITLKQAKEAGVFNVAIKGPLSSPINTFGKGLFNDVLTRRLQQKAVEKLPDLLGKDLGGKLQDLGILPPKQKAAPAPSPAPDAAAPVEPTPEPQPQSPEDALRQEGQKAIEGVLKGLLQ